MGAADLSSIDDGTFGVDPVDAGHCWETVTKSSKSKSNSPVSSYSSCPTIIASCSDVSCSVDTSFYNRHFKPSASLSSIHELVKATALAYAIADSGATHHMFPDYSVFISYRCLMNKFVRLADKTLSPIHGVGMVKVLLNNKVITLRDVYHVLSLRAPLYSLRQHRRLPGCGFIGVNDGFNVYFPTFTLHVDDYVDAYLNYTPIGCRIPVSSHYIQPKDHLILAMASPSHLIPLNDYDDSSSVPTDDSITFDYSSVPTPKRQCPSFDLRMSESDLLAFASSPTSDPPAIRLCDTPGPSDPAPSSLHLTSDQNYHLFGNRRFR